MGGGCLQETQVRLWLVSLMLQSGWQLDRSLWDRQGMTSGFLLSSCLAVPQDLPGEDQEQLSRLMQPTRAAATASELLRIRSARFAQVGEGALEGLAALEVMAQRQSQVSTPDVTR